jgi:hypothetical protein
MFRVLGEYYSYRKLSLSSYVFIFIYNSLISLYYLLDYYKNGVRLIAISAAVAAAVAAAAPLLNTSSLLSNLSFLKPLKLTFCILLLSLLLLPL